jgi:hypothetical protein
VEVDGESTSRDRGNAKQARPLQRPVGPADTREVRPRLVALVLLVLLASCGGPERPAEAPAADELVGTADVERLLVSTQKRKSPTLRVGAASCPDQVRLANGTAFTGTITLGDAVQKVTAEVKDLKGTVVVRG